MEELAAHSAGRDCVVAGGGVFAWRSVQGGRANSRQGNSRQSPVPSHQSPATMEGDFWGEGGLYIEVQHLSAGDGQVVREALRLGRELGIPLVATTNVHFLRPEEHFASPGGECDSKTGGLLTTVAPPEITTGEGRWFKPAVEMQRFVSGSSGTAAGDAGNCSTLQPGIGAGQDDFPGVSGAGR